MSEKILCVDDDLAVLAALQRTFRKQFDISSAHGGENALKIIAERGPFAVIVSDLKMPGMDGIRFLAKSREVSPESVRILFTGEADVRTAAHAVNHGSISQFLTKPCPPETFARAVNSALDQYKLAGAERDLLQNTLRGSVKVLTDILTMLNPQIFGHANRIRQYVLDIATVMNAPDTWCLEVAAMLSQIGCMTLPAELLSKAFAGGQLTEEERRMYASHPVTGAKLIGSIPRLEIAALMIEGQMRPFRSFKPGARPQEQQAAIGAQALRLAIDYDRCLSRGLSYEVAFAELTSRTGEYNPEMLTALARCGTHGRMQKKSIQFMELEAGMVADDDVYSLDGALLVAKDLDISAPLIESLRRIAASRGVREPIRILAPIDESLEGSAVRGSLVS